MSSFVEFIEKKGVKKGFVPHEVKKSIFKITETTSMSNVNSLYNNKFEAI